MISPFAHWSVWIINSRHRSVPPCRAFRRSIVNLFHLPTWAGAKRGDVQWGSPQHCLKHQHFWFHLKCGSFTLTKFLCWPSIDFCALLSNWQKMEALYSYWSLNRGPPSSTTLQPSYPQSRGWEILCVGEGGFEYLYHNYGAFKNSICVKSQQLSLNIIYRPLNYHYNWHLSVHQLTPLWEQWWVEVLNWDPWWWAGGGGATPLKLLQHARLHTGQEAQISVIIFYSHMLHFALNVHVTLSGQTQKVWVSTYSNVLYSLFIHTEPQELSDIIYTRWPFGLRSFTKMGVTAK